MRLDDMMGSFLDGSQRAGTFLKAHLSICERNLVAKMPRIRSLSDSLPPKSRPRSVKCISTFLTTSPRYMPLIIFSYLKGHERSPRGPQG